MYADCVEIYLVSGRDMIVTAGVYLGRLRKTSPYKCKEIQMHVDVFSFVLWLSSVGVF